MPTTISLKKCPALKGRAGYWVVIALDSGKVVLQAKTLAEAVRLAKEKGIQHPSYDIVPDPNFIYIL